MKCRMEWKYYFLCLLLSVSSSTGIWAQGQNLGGVVVDEVGEPLPNAQVVVWNGDKVTSFLLTDEKGQYAFEQPMVLTDSLTIEFRYFGYAAKTFMTNEITVENLLRVVLRQEEIELKTVVVSAEALPQLNRGDTTIFKTTTYRDGSEKKIEEVIAKLPGVEVDQEGNIKVQGKPLDRILVDGEDLFDKNYKLLSKNVPADFVDRIDIIKNYHGDALVGDLAGKKEIAMNLQLDKDRKGLVFGEANAELGNADHCFADINLFHFGKKIKAVNFSDYSRLGSASSAGSDLLIKSQGLNAREPTDILPVLRSPATQQQRLVRPEDYLTNNALGVAQSVLARINRNTKNRLVFNFSRDNYSLDDFRIRENITPSSVDTFRQERHFNYGAHRFWVKNDLEAILNRRSRIDFRISATGMIRDASTRTVNETVQEQEELRTDLRDQPLNYLLSLRYVRRLNPSLALRLSGSWQSQQFDQLQIYRGSVYRQVLNHPVGAGIAQRFDQNNRNATFEGDLLQKVGKYNLNHTLGWREVQVETDLNLSLLDEEERGGNLIDYILKETYLRSTFRRTFTKLDLSGGVTASLFQLPYTNQLVQHRTRQVMALQPNVRLDYRLNRRNQLEIWGRSSRNTQSAEELVSVPYLASGSILTAGLDSAFLFRKITYGVNYQYTNSFAQYGYSFQFYRSATPNSLSSRINTDDFVVVEQLFPGVASSMTSFGASGNIYIAKAKTNVKLTVKYNQLYSQLDFTGELVDTKIGNTHFSMRSNTKILKSTAYGLYIGYDRFSNALFESTSQQSQAYLEQKLVFRPNKLLRIIGRHQAYLPRLGSGAILINLISARISYDFPGNDLNFGGGINNLLNQGAVLERDISLYQRSQRMYQLRPRTVYISVGYDF